MLLPSPQHILITGASSGLGEALALYYAAPGIVLSLSGRDEERLQAVAQTCEKKGANVSIEVIDVRDADGMKAWVQGREAGRPIDLLLANAGISAGTGGDPAGEDQAQAERIFAVNWQGVLNTVYPVLPAMLARRGGQIALMSSLAGYRGCPGAPAYCASKAAVKIWGESLRGSLNGAGVKVSVICPGFVESRMTAANDFPMPFIIPADRAAAVIAKGLARNKGRIAFPWPMAAFMRLLSVLPDGPAQLLLKPMPGKRRA